MNSRKIFNALIGVLGVVFILYYLGMGFAVRFGQSLLWLWPLMGAACIIRWLVVRKSIATGKQVPIPQWLIKLFRVCVCCGLALFLIVQGFIISAAKGENPSNLNYLIVLGAKVNGTRPSGALSQRISSAAEYLNNNPNTICIASGGQGEDEGISEAECIKNGLVLRGIDETRIVLEDASVSTETNFINSYKLINKENEAVGVVTNDFHMLRALWNGRQLGNQQLYAIPARSTVWGYAHYCLREFCAIVVGVISGELNLNSMPA